jgi:predicted RNase H-like nuclease (RuvC/YqgF family)
MEDSLAKLHAKLDSIDSKLTKIDVIEQTMNTLVVENAALREEIRSKDKVIDELCEKVNKLDQSARTNSLRIHGLPVTSNTPATEIPYIVHREILTPIFEAAKLKGDLPPSTPPPSTSPCRVPSSFQPRNPLPPPL